MPQYEKNMEELRIFLQDIVVRYKMYVHWSGLFSRGQGAVRIYRLDTFAVCGRRVPWDRVRSSSGIRMNAVCFHALPDRGM